MEVFVGDVAKRGIDGVALAEEIRDVPIDLFFGAMKLEIEAALGVGDGSDIKEKRFPLEAGAPDDAFEAKIEIGAGVDEKFHHRAAVILVAVDGVEQGSVTTKAVGVEVRTDVYVEAGIEEGAGAVDGIVFGAEVQGGDPLEGSESAGKKEAAVERVGRGLEELAETGGVVEEKSFEEGIAERGSAIEHDSEAFGKARGAQIHFDKDEDGSFAVDGGVGVKARGKNSADFFRGVDFEGEEEIVGKWHRGIKTF